MREGEKRFGRCCEVICIGCPCICAVVIVYYDYIWWYMCIIMYYSCVIINYE